MPKKKGAGNLVGAWAFLIGVVLAVVFGFLPLATWVTWVLFILGLIIGILNITTQEVNTFLMAGTVLVIVAALGAGAFLTIPYIPNIVENILILFVPATIVVALRSVFSMARR
ncbi:MAG: hypothetical protein ABH817_00975 [archaeon]